MLGTDLNLAKTLLGFNQLVAIPTETVYGLAGNALSELAVTQIFEVKNRPSFDPLIIHVASVSDISHYVTDFPEKAQRLAQAFMPGPLTLLLPKKDTIPDLVTSGSALVAIRVPAHPLTAALLQSLDFPLAAPSANPFGYISPTTAAHVAKQLGEKIPYILDGGACDVGLESTIVGFDGDEVIIYRKGGLAVETIEHFLEQTCVVLEHSSSNPQAPGMLKSHYAPRAPFIIGDLPTLINTYQDKKLGILSFQNYYPSTNNSTLIQLSPRGDYAEAARRLFAALRELDALDLDCIVGELLPEEGLGRAINDRLRRAAAK